jgi:alpha-tubulin suppressor-like RCC1 family protein
VSKRNFRSTLSLLTAALLALTTLVVPTAANAAVVESRGVYVDASGRAGSKIVVTVISKLPAGATSTTDIAWAYLSYGQGTSSTYSSNFAYSSTPFRVANSLAYFKITLNAGTLPGSHGVNAGVALAGSTTTFSAICNVDCKSSYTEFEVGSSVSAIKFSSRILSLSPSPTRNIGDLTPSSFVLYDAAGRRTLLTDTETVVLSTASAPVGNGIAYATGYDSRTATTGATSLTLNSSNNNGDGIYRLKLGTTSLGTTVTTGTVSNSLGAITSSVMTIQTSNEAVTGKQVSTLDNYGGRTRFASGSDGKLYIWGEYRSGLEDAITGLDIAKATYIKPTLIDFPRATNGSTKNFVSQLVGAGDGTTNGAYVLADDGTVWAISNSGLSIEQRTSGTLEPIFTFNASSNYVTQVSNDARVFLLADGKVLTRSTGWVFSLADLSSISNPTITQIGYMSASATSIYLGSNGKVYSTGSNTYGELGQGSDTATTLGEVLLPSNRTVSKIYAGNRYGVIKMQDGSYWSWGDNRAGQQGKLASEVPYSNTPRVVIIPANFEVLDIYVSSQIVLLGATGYYTSSGGGWTTYSWSDYGISGTLSRASFSATYSDYGTSIYRNSSIVADSEGRIFQIYGGATGSCNATGGRIRSDGQFGERWFIDPVQSGSKLYIDTSTTVSITGAISVKVNTAFTIQAANVKTNCYQTSELTFAWDKDGDGTYETSDTPTVGDTGYLGLNANFNFSSAGRRNVALGVTTPDSVTLRIPFVIGVEPVTRSLLSPLDTGTATIATVGNSSIALTASGGVYAWGANDYGQLGVSPTLYTRRNIPMSLVLPDTVTPVSVSGNSQTSFVVDSLGKVWGFGRGIYIDGTSNTYTSARQVSYLQSIKVRELRDNLILTTDGRLLIWSPNDRTIGTIPSLAGIYIKGFAMRNENYGCGSSYDSSIYYIANAIDSDGNLWKIPISSSWVAGDAELLSIQNVSSIKGYSGRAVIKTTTGDIYYSVSGGCEFGVVTKPAGTTVVDVAPFSQDYTMIALTDTLKNVWTASVAQSTGVFQPGTWTKLSAIDAVRASTSDAPVLFASAPNYIGFASGRVFSNYTSYYENGTCGNSGSRLYSTGQFGTSFFQDSIAIGSSTAYIGAAGAVTFNSGQAFAGQAADNLVFKLSNPRSSCFTGATQLTATADLDGNGSYETNLTATNESGTYSFIITAAAPSSGRRTYSFKIETPIGTSKVFTATVGVYASTSNSSVTARSKVFNTSYNTSVSVGTDGYAYAWGGGISFMNILTSTPPRTELKPTKIEITGNPTIIDAATYVNYDYDEDFGLMVVDSTGKVWSWGTRRNMDAPASTFAVGSVPTTPTQVMALDGINIKRISLGSDGYRGLALSDAGNVYQWNSTNRTPTLVTGLAGIAVKNIWASNNLYAALSTSGVLYTWDGNGINLGRTSVSNPDCYWCQDLSVGAATISDTVADVSVGFGKYGSVSTALTTTGKLFSWGSFRSTQIYTPEQHALPGGRTPVAIGSMGSSLLVVASDKTWWKQSLDVNGNIVYFQKTDISSTVRDAFSGFSTGLASGIYASNSNLYTLTTENAGTCGNVGTAARVMSEGQFGTAFADDAIDLTINGNEISRPNEDNYFTITASSRCFGATGVAITADLTGGGTYSSPVSSTTAEDGSSVTSRFKFRPTANGALTIRGKATTTDSIVGTRSYYTLVVPLPPAGRQIGVSINSGARYANNSNVTLDLVWPDGVYKIYVSNDGGFAPGTVTEIDLQTQIAWVLPPQAVIPLPSIVYARFGDSTNYYFDDIILDAISPVLTFASAR